MILEAFDEEGVSFEGDVKPALGPEIGIVALELDEDEIVGFTKGDAAKLRELAEKSDEPTVTREVEGWTLIADDEATLDAFEQARAQGSLSDSDDFQDTMGIIEGDALATMYVRGDALQAEIESAEEGCTDLDAFFGEFPSLAFALSVEEGGVRLEGAGKFDPEEAGYSFPYEAKLPEVAPGGALAYLSFSRLDGIFSKFRDAAAQCDPEFERELGQFEAMVGVSLEEDIAPLFAGEGAVYVRRGALIPEVTLVTEVEDEEQAVGTLDEVVGGLGAFVDIGEPQRREVDGVEVREVPISPPFSLSYAAFDGLLVVTTSTDGIADLRADEDRLADDEAFQDALDRAEVPGETSGFAYVDLEETLPLLFGFAEVGLGETSEARQYTEPLTSLVVWGDQDGSTQSFSLFVGIE
jgi:hypothetical protein